MMRALTLSAALAVLAGLTSLAACSSTASPPTVIARPLALPIPSCAPLTPVPASAFHPVPKQAAALIGAHVDVAITDATYATLVERERTLRTCARKRGAVLRANNRHAHERVTSPSSKEQP
jgi:hypothetical protein